MEDDKQPIEPSTTEDGDHQTPLLEHSTAGDGNHGNDQQPQILEPLTNGIGDQSKVQRVWVLGFDISEAFPYPEITGQNWSPFREIPGSRVLTFFR